MKFTIFSKRASSWRDLSHAEQMRVAKRMVKHFSRARYNIVDSPEVNLRGRGHIETKGEDEILPHYLRGEFLDLARNGVRNSQTLAAILKQFQLNVIGTVGGKASFVLDDGRDGASDAIRRLFARYTQSCEFFDGLPLSRLLAIALKTQLIGGDLVLVFDDGLIEGSGRILAFEPDCIGNLPKDYFAEKYPKFTQRQGRIYTSNNRFCGVIVSLAERGKEEFDPAKSFVLTRDPNAPLTDCNWTMLREVWRPAQGRGVSPISTSLGAIIDLEDVTRFEVSAAKKNSQTIAQVLQTEAQEPLLTGGLDGRTDFSDMSDSELSEAVADAADDTQTVTLDKIRAAGCLYEVMPANAKLELLDTKHPNANMPEFIRWLAGRSAASLGLGSVYATLKADASYTAFRGEQVMSWPAFEEAQKMLERCVCDWLLANWSRHYAAEIDDINLPLHWQERVEWQWPRMREVNQVDEQNALALKLKNCTGTFADIYGADWRAKLAQVAKEKDFCQSLGLIHPATQTVSGQLIDDVTTKKEDE